MTEAEVARRQIEIVFCLGGGELEDEPWSGFTFWYEEVPDYATADHDVYDVEWEYRTAVVHELFSEAPTPEGWERVQAYQTSGEAECYCNDSRGPGVGCDVCDEGTVYLGETWREVVYRRAAEGVRTCTNPACTVTIEEHESWCAACAATLD